MVPMRAGPLGVPAFHEPYRRHSCRRPAGWKAGGTGFMATQQVQKEQDASHELDRGRDKGLNLAPPSEPDGRISRIRLSSQWVRSFYDCPRPLVFRCQGQQPTAGKPFIRPALMGRPQPLAHVHPRRHCSRLRNRRRT